MTIGRRQQLGANAERALEAHGFLERAPHLGPDPDQRAAADVARGAADGRVEVAIDRERARDHDRGLSGRVELADDAHRSSGPAGADEAALEHEHVANAGQGQVKRDRDSGRARADDDDVGGSRQA